VNTSMALMLTRIDGNPGSHETEAVRLESGAAVLGLFITCRTMISLGVVMLMTIKPRDTSPHARRRNMPNTHMHRAVPP
jgi:hypothetical protein